MTAITFRHYKYLDVVTIIKIRYLKWNGFKIFFRFYLNNILTKYIRLETNTKANMFDKFTL